MNAQATTVQVTEREFLLLKLCEEHFCIPTSHVREIRQWTQPTFLPGTKNYVIGAINLRGMVLPIINLATMLGQNPIKISPRNPVVIVETDGHLCGYMVTSASVIFTVSEENVGLCQNLESVDESSLLGGVVFYDRTMVQLLSTSQIAQEICPRT